MTDIFTKSQRSSLMSRIGGRNTKPEILVRSILHKNGYRFRLHRTDLPGKPDICLPKYKTVIFVHGCFWHRHSKCKKGRSFPSTNEDFWEKKFIRTIQRDNEISKKLEELGWKVITVWECELKNSERFVNLLLKKISD